MRLRERGNLVHKILSELNLNSDLEGGLGSPEALAAMLRRVAGMYCPASRSALIRATIEPLRDLVVDSAILHQRTSEVLEAAIAHGDLIELPEVTLLGEVERILVYAAPPAIVERQSGALFVLGIAGEQESLLPREVESQVEHRAHLRILPASIATNITPHLEDLGYLRFSQDAWLDRPDHIGLDTLIERFDIALQAEPYAHSIEGLRVVSPSKNRNFYRNRWTDGSCITGRVVGRRPQAYGADIWCYVELVDGKPLRFLDLPSIQSRYRGCDEAWRLLAALDAKRGHAQHLRIRPGEPGTAILDVFSPLPSWFVRRWNSVGEPVLCTQGALISYRVNNQDITEEVEFARNMMWLNAKYEM